MHQSRRMLCRHRDRFALALFGPSALLATHVQRKYGNVQRLLQLSLLLAMFEAPQARFTTSPITPDSS
jgi:hypothetical protein